MTLCVQTRALGEQLRGIRSSVAGVSGFLVKSGDNFGIMYATHIKIVL